MDFEHHRSTPPPDASLARSLTIQRQSTAMDMDKLVNQDLQAILRCLQDGPKTARDKKNKEKKEKENKNEEKKRKKN
jgi:hypothetical protein